MINLIINFKMPGNRYYFDLYPIELELVSVVVLESVVELDEIENVITCYRWVLFHIEFRLNYSLALRMVGKGLRYLF
jgi:hypothetical protein